MATGSYAEDAALSPVALDRILLIMVAMGLFLLFAAPTRLFYIPIEFQTDYWTVPPNFIDLVWVSIGVALFIRAGRMSAWVLLGTAALVILGLCVIVTGTAPMPEKFADLFLFNIRLIGGLTIGWLMVQAGISEFFLGTALSLGSLIIALSTFTLAQSDSFVYDQYDESLRYGGMGLPPNEAAIIMAAAFNAIPLLFPRRKWLAVISPILLTGILITGSRTGVLLIIPGVFLWVPAIIKSFKGSRAILAWIVFMAAAAFEILLIIQVFAALITGQLLFPVASRLGNTADASTAGRLLIYISVPVYLAKDLPVLLFGTGGSNVAVEWFLKDVVGVATYHAHSLLLQFLVAYGLAGVLLTTIIVFPLLRRGRRYPGDGAKAIRWFALTVTLGQTIQYGMSLEKFLLLFTIPAGFAAAISARKPAAEPA